MSVLTLKQSYSPKEVREAVNALDVRLDDLEALAVTDEVGDGTVTTEKLETAILSADAAGRACFAAGVFDATTALSVFGADSIANAFLLDAIADGAFADSAATRALFADAIWTEAKMAANTLTEASLAARIRGAHQALSGAGAVNLTTPVTRFTSTGAAQALTLADGTVAGHRKRIIHVLDGGSGVLTAGGSLHLGDSLATITLATVWDWVELEWQNSNTSWNVVGWAGAGVAFA
jgi:hypothetical protein